MRPSKFDEWTRMTALRAAEKTSERRARLEPCRRRRINGTALTAEVRFLRGNLCVGGSMKRRTSEAKALNSRGLYGTAEAVPFVKIRCMARLKRLRKKSGLMKKSLPQQLKPHSVQSSYGRPEG